MPVTYPFVPVPQINPLGSLSELMSLASQMQGLSDRSRARRASEEATRRQGMIREVGRLTQGDPAAYAREVGVIDPEYGRQVQADVDQRAIQTQDRAQAALTQRQREFADMVTRIDRAEGVYGQGAQLLREAERDPTAWPDLRPRLVELATSIHPERGSDLARMIPETYNPAQVRELVTSITQEHGKLQRFQKATREFIGDGNPVEGLSQMLQLMETDAERDQILERARYFGMPDEQITLAQRHAKRATETAAATAQGQGTEFERFIRARQRELGRPLRRDEFLTERAAYTASGRDPREPNGDETWLANQLRDLDALRRPQVDRVTRETIQPVITSEADAQREEDRIYDLYRGMAGHEHPSRPVRRPAQDRGVRIRRADGSWAVPEGWPESGAPADQGVARPSAPRTAASPIGPSSATAAPSARPAVTAPSRPMTQSAIPQASDFRMVDNVDGSVTVTAPDGSTVPFRTRREAQAQIDRYLQQIAQP